MVSFLAADVFGYKERNLIQNRVHFEQICASIVTDQAWVPYPDYTDRTGWDRLTGKHKEIIISCGEEYLGYEWKVIKVTDYLKFNATGNRASMESPYYANLRALANLLAAELAEGKGRFVSPIADGVYHMCEMSSWAISAHIAKFSKTEDAMPFKGDDTLELGQGDMCQLLSWTHYFLRSELDKIHPEICSRLRQEIKHRELDPYLEREDYWWMGFKVDREREMLNNWNPWCNTNALVTFMLMEEDPLRLAQAVWKSIRSVDLYLNFLTGDGGIEEGSTYWAASAGMLYNYLHALDMVTEGAASVFDCPMIRNMGEFFVRSYVGDGWVVNFADASARWNYSHLPLIYGYGKATGSKIMQDFASAMRAHSDGMPKPDIRFGRFLEALQADREMGQDCQEIKLPKYSCYPETGFHFERNDDGLFFAAATGNNGQSHNHNDIGSFILYVDNTPLIMDIGVGTYTKQTFSHERYRIWTMQSAYHNVPLVNGHMQKNGKKYRAEDVRSSIGNLTLDIAGCYPAAADVKTWKRGYRLDGKSLKITDRFEIGKPTERNEVVFMAHGQVEKSAPGVLMLTCGNVGAELRYSDAAFDTRIEVLSLDDPKLTTVWGDEVYRIVLTARKLQKKDVYRYEIIKR